MNLPKLYVTGSNHWFNPKVVTFLSRFFRDVPNRGYASDLEALVHHWVAANRKPKSTASVEPGRNPQRWQAEPIPEFEGMEPYALLEDFRELGFVDEWNGLSDKTVFDALVIPGGLPQPQRQRLGYGRKLWLDGVRWKRLFFVTNRKLDLTKDTPEAIMESREGALPLRAGWTPPTFQEGDTEVQLMDALWKGADLPTKMAAISPMYITDARDLYTAGLGVGNVGLVTIQPHAPFHTLMYRRLLSDVTLTVIAPAATNARHDNDYLADGFARWLGNATKNETNGLIVE